MEREGSGTLFCSSLDLQCLECCLTYNMHSINICWMNGLATKIPLIIQPHPGVYCPELLHLWYHWFNTPLNLTPYPSILFTRWSLISHSYSQTSLDSLPQTLSHLVSSFLSSLPFLDSLDSIIPNALLSVSSLTPNFITNIWVFKSLTHLGSLVCF